MGLKLDGPKALARAFPGWFELYVFAHISPPAEDEPPAHDPVR